MNKEFIGKFSMKGILLKDWRFSLTSLNPTIDTIDRMGRKFNKKGNTFNFKDFSIHCPITRFIPWVDPDKLVPEVVVGIFPGFTTTVYIENQTINEHRARIRCIIRRSVQK